jgi:hypothetical protein
VQHRLALKPPVEQRLRDLADLAPARLDAEMGGQLPVAGQGPNGSVAAMSSPTTTWPAPASCASRADRCCRTWPTTRAPASEASRQAMSPRPPEAPVTRTVRAMMLPPFPMAASAVRPAVGKAAACA